MAHRSPKVDISAIKILAQGYMEYLLAFKNVEDFRRYVLAPPNRVKSSYNFRQVLVEADKDWQTRHPEGVKSSFIGDIDVEAVLADYFSLGKRHFQTAAISYLTADRQRFALFIDVINEQRRGSKAGIEIVELTIKGKD